MGKKCAFSYCSNQQSKKGKTKRHIQFHRVLKKQHSYKQAEEEDFFLSGTRDLRAANSSSILKASESSSQWVRRLVGQKIVRRTFFSSAASRPSKPSNRSKTPFFSSISHSDEPQNSPSIYCSSNKLLNDHTASQLNSLLSDNVPATKNNAAESSIRLEYREPTKDTPFFKKLIPSLNQNADLLPFESQFNCLTFNEASNCVTPQLIQFDPQHSNFLHQLDYNFHSTNLLVSNSDDQSFSLNTENQFINKTTEYLFSDNRRKQSTAKFHCMSVELDLGDKSSSNQFNAFDFLEPSVQSSWHPKHIDNNSPVSFVNNVLEDNLVTTKTPQVQPYDENLHIPTFRRFTQHSDNHSQSENQVGFRQNDLLADKPGSDMTNSAVVSSPTSKMSKRGEAYLTIPLSQHGFFSSHVNCNFVTRNEASVVPLEIKEKNGFSQVDNEIFQASKDNGNLGFFEDAFSICNSNKHSNHIKQRNNFDTFSSNDFSDVFLQTHSEQNFIDIDSNDVNIFEKVHQTDSFSNILDNSKYLERNFSVPVEAVNMFESSDRPVTLNLNKFTYEGSQNNLQSISQVLKGMENKRYAANNSNKDQIHKDQQKFFETEQEEDYNLDIPGNLMTLNMDRKKMYSGSSKFPTVTNTPIRDSFDSFDKNTTETNDSDDFLDLDEILMDNDK